MGNQITCEEVCPPGRQFEIVNPIQICCTARTDNEIADNNQIQPVVFDQPEEQNDEEKPTFEHDKDTQQVPIKILNKMQTITKLKTHKQTQIDHVLQNPKSNPIKPPNSQLPSSELVIVSNLHGKGVLDDKIKYQPIPVPFKIIKLAVNPAIMKKIELDYKSVFDSLQTYKDQASWKLLKQGCYARIASKSYGTFFCNEIFYQGGFTEKEDGTLLPHGEGLLISKDMRFKGDFAEGHAHGQGELHDQIKQRIYWGTWSCGSLKSGNAKHPQFCYEGYFHNNIPDGQGVLILSQNKILYRGLFKRGKFHDPDGYYQCKTYIYLGGFSAGRKCGEGVLTFKTDNIQRHTVQQKNRKISQIQGTWQKDRLIKEKNIITQHD